MIPARVITVSDRCSAGLAEDLSGPLAARLLAEHGVEASVTVIPDEVEAIRAAITSAAASGARLVFTTGGTGLAPRDVTPEATAPLLATRIDAPAAAIRRRREQTLASAAPSRGLVGVTARSDVGTLVVNAPGSRGGVTDAVAVIGPLVAHIIDQLADGDHPRAWAHPFHALLCVRGIRECVNPRPRGIVTARPSYEATARRARTPGWPTPRR